MELRPEIIIDNVDIIETPNYPKINQNEFFIPSNTEFGVLWSRLHTKVTPLGVLNFSI
jgi:hypothetical protein